MCGFEKMKDAQLYTFGILENSEKNREKYSNSEEKSF